MKTFSELVGLHDLRACRPFIRSDNPDKHVSSLSPTLLALQLSVQFYTQEYFDSRHAEGIAMYWLSMQ